MANQVNIIEQCTTTVQVTDQVKEVVQVVTLGPQGPMGPKGDAPEGFNQLTASFYAFTSSYNTGSFTGSFYGQVYGSASYATTASWAAYAANVPDTASFAVSSSYAVSSSFANSSQYPIKATGSFSLYGPGAGDQASTANVILLGNSAGNLVAHANGAVMLGASAGGSMRSGSNSVVIGTQAGEFSTYARSAVFLGNQAGRGATYASYSVMIGELAGSNSEPLAYSVLLGYAAGSSINGAQASTRYSNFIGHYAGIAAYSSSYSNFLGYFAGYGAQSSMFSNFIGYRAGYSDGSTWPGNNTTIIGTNISLAQNLNNYINLGAVLFISGTYSDQNAAAPFTGSNNGRVGINTTLPAYSLDVSGSGRFTGPLLANNLTGSLYGTASWALNVVGLSATSSYALTASYAPAYLPLTGGTITGDIQVLGTASIAFLNVTYESSSVIYSSGSNQLGDSELDFQRFYGTVTVVTGSLSAPIFSGSGANLFNIPASAVTGLSTSQINTGSVVAKVDTGTGSFALSSGSSTFLFVSSSGNVGIGTTTPLSILHLSQNYGGGVENLIPQAILENTGNTSGVNYSAFLRTRISNGYTGGFPEFWVEATRTASNQGFLRLRGVSNHPVSIWANDSEKVRFFPTGNVLIQSGGTFTDDGQRLQVVGSAKITSGLTVSGSGGSAYALTTTNGWVQFGSTTGFTWDDTNSRVGIGTNAPSVALAINGNDNDQIQILDNNSSVGYFYGSANGDYLQVVSSRNALNLSATNRVAIVNSAIGNAAVYGVAWNANAFVVDKTLSVFNSKLLVGTNTDSGYRLEVNGSGSASGSLRVVSGSTLLVGAGNTSATTALTVQNSDGTQLIRMQNQLLAGNQTGLQIGDGTNANTTFITLVKGAPTIQTRYLDVRTTADILYIAGGTGVGNNNLAFNHGSITLGDGNYTLTNATQFNVAVSVTGNFVPTSGSASFIDLLIRPTINQTGGANGITRGIYINPTLTAAADWRSIEWSNNTGWGLYGAGTASNYLAGRLSIGTTVTGSALTVYKSGSTVVDVQGSTGQLFSVVDSMTGSLMSVNDISGIPLLSVNSNGAMYVNSATQNSVTGSFTVYSIDSTSGNAAYFDYRVFNPITSGSRAGTVMAVWFGSSVEATDTSTNDLIADTSGISFSADVSSSLLRVNATVTTGSWNVKIGARVI